MYSLQRCRIKQGNLLCQLGNRHVFEPINDRLLPKTLLRLCEHQIPNTAEQARIEVRRWRREMACRLDEVVDDVLDYTGCLLKPSCCAFDAFIFGS